MVKSDKSAVSSPSVLVFIAAWQEEAKVGEIVRTAKKYVKDVLVINHASKVDTP